MPNRVLKEALLTSVTVNEMETDEEVMFTRLVVVADDYGRFDADPRVLLAKCFPLRVDRLTVAQVERWRDSLTGLDAIRLYESRGHVYGYFPKWFDHQRPARSKSKFPAPPRKPSDDNPPTIDSGLTTIDGYLREAGSEKRDNVKRMSAGFVVADELLARWSQTYPGVDVPFEVRKAWEWEQAHPDRRKVNLQAFLVRWLARAQDQSRGRPNGEPPKQRPAVLQQADLTPEQIANRDRGLAMVAAAVGALPKMPA